MGRISKIPLLFLLVSLLEVARAQARWPTGREGEPLAWGRMVLVTGAVVAGVYFLTRLVKVKPVYRLVGPDTGAVDFGAIDVGNVRALPVKFVNPGGRAVRFQAEVMGTQFVLAQPAVGSVPPGKEIALAVEYRPTQAGPASAILSVIIVDQREALRVELLGQGRLARDETLGTAANSAAGASDYLLALRLQARNEVTR